MIKQRRKRKSNKGNSFIVVVATISFLAVLVAALLVAVAMCFRLKAYDINSRDNFYYLEQAMDEIYEGVGAISMKHLNEAYDETAEVLVYFDPAKKSYVTMDNNDANELMKATYVNKLGEDTRLTSAAIATTLSGFIRDKATYKIELEAGNVTKDPSSGAMTIEDIVLKRTAEYSTVNTAKKNADDDKIGAAKNFVQTITTDLTISVPDFNVNFDSVGNNISELYDFVLISDMGVEIKGIGTSSNITGNVYAASDFYNKVYNETGKNTGDVEKESDTTRVNPINVKVNSYDDAKLKQCDGVSEQSMYSGFYISGAKVSILADKLIIPGSIAAMNCASLNVMGSIEGSGATPTKIWADGIVLGGYSRKSGAGSTSYRGSSLKMLADAYVYDDLEVNAMGSSFALDGTYYGYNFASTDNRTYSDEFIAKAMNRKFSKDKDGNSYVKINDGNYIADNGEGGHLTGQAHYNSSAIVVNGEDSTLNLENVDSMYIAGQAYVEMSKSTTKSTYDVTVKDDGTLEWGEPVADDTVADSTKERITRETYAYEGQSSDNYTLNSDGSVSSIQDYRTGEGLSVKSNQLAYIPPYNVYEEDGQLYVKWPTSLASTDYFKDMWTDLSKVPVIKTVVGGSEYYFYDFSKAKSNITMNEYMEKYADLFQLSGGETRSKGELANFYDITDYELFKVDDFSLDDSKIYSNSAISIKEGGKVSIKADSKSVTPLLTAKDALDDKLKNELGTDVTDSNTDIEKTVYAKNLTSKLQKEYKEMKMLLTNKPGSNISVETAYTADEGTITPINFYFNFLGLNGISNSSAKAKTNMKSGYKVFLGEGDVEVKAETGKTQVKGIVICKGDVTFDSNIKEFEGLIVSGGKIIVNHSINFVSNPEIIKSVLRECDESVGTGNDLSYISKMFRQYVSESTAPTPDSSSNIVSMRSVSAVQYEDILAFKNWKKNVD